jgi:hypothetical protein
MSSSVPNPDYGIDVILHEIKQVNRRRFESGFKLDVQAKSTTLALAEKATIRYDLEVRNYESLRFRTAGSPRILVVLVLPEEENDWLVQMENELILCRCAYWMSLRGFRARRNRRKVRLAIPRSQVFSVAALRSILERMKAGGKP